MIRKITEIPNSILYEFLSYCMSPNPQRIEQECAAYRAKDRELFGIYLEETLIGIAGLLYRETETELKHLAIHPDFRKQGHGIKLVAGIIEQLNTATLFAETDRDAVLFYKKIGFTPYSLGEKYPGVERFKCVYSNWREPVTEYRH